MRCIVFRRDMGNTAKSFWSMLKTTSRLVKMWFGIGTCVGSHGGIQSRKLQWKYFVMGKEPEATLLVEYPRSRVSI
jgi:hypothetical protein